MSAVSTVLYPKGTKFNMDYYLSSHMKKVGDDLKQHGLQSWSVYEYPPESDYLVQATLIWKDEQSAQNAMGTGDMKEILADVPNFSDKQPAFWSGKVAGSG